MQNLGLMGVIAAGAVFAAGGAFAAGAFHAEAKLSSPASAPVSAMVADVSWRCDGDACVGTAENHSSLDNPLRECRKVASALGPLSAYTTRGTSLSAGELKLCNVAAAGKASGSATAQK